MNSSVLIAFVGVLLIVYGWVSRGDSRLVDSHIVLFVIGATLVGRVALFRWLGY